MGKIFYIMGKSASGKDKIYSELLQNEKLGLKELVLYTTRPIRHGEEDGKQYYFVDDKRLNQLRNEGKIIEERAYQTVHGIWTYFTADEGQIALEQANYIGIGTLESYGKMRQYFGPEKIVPVYVEVEDGIRLERALIREKKQEQPKYKEMCRRFLADSEDFSESKLSRLGIKERYENRNMRRCLAKLIETIEKESSSNH